MQRDEFEALRPDVDVVDVPGGARLGSANPGITVIVPTFNSADHIAACLASVRLCLADAEVIVVDNASTDETCEVVRAVLPAAVLLAGEENVGFGRACNLGAERASNSHILYLNPDAELVSVNRIELATAAESAPFGMLAVMLVEGDAAARSTLRRHSGHWLNEFVGVHLLAMLSRYAPRPRYVREASGSGTYTVGGVAFMVSVEEFRAVGGFDERFFMYYEDTDLTQRYLRRCYPLRSSAALLVRHVGGASAPMPRRNALSFLGWLEYIDKWHGPAAAARGATVARIAYFILLSGLRVITKITGSARFRAKADQVALMLSNIATQGFDEGAAGGATRYPAAGLVAKRKFAFAAMEDNTDVNTNKQ